MRRRQVEEIRWKLPERARTIHGIGLEELADFIILDCR
jgi:hypothetical protein